MPKITLREVVLKNYPPGSKARVRDLVQLLYPEDNVLSRYASRHTLDLMSRIVASGYASHDYIVEAPPGSTKKYRLVEWTFLEPPESSGE